MWGDRCDIPCSKGCLNRDCRFDGICHCRPGYTGSECIAPRMDEELPVADPTSITSATDNYNGLNTHQDGVSKPGFYVLLCTTVILILITMMLSFLLVYRLRTYKRKYARDLEDMLQRDTFCRK
ncbi:uncharacterized protein LOC121368980 [Gigantopelta aegis]|uniref:uncharacterized protein LOC121368980 n=1 Tax=Gigantopelta aegis TaxID=1735272 RepID=UPI001B88CCE7|nr:uncharacterized protein LOC121368980 [Gigantopelta aegis]